MTDPSRHDPAARRLTIAFVVIAALLGACQAFDTRFTMNPDGIEYLDNATAWAAADYSTALNSLWSPLYPWLIAAIFSAVHPDPFLEFPVVHLLNFLIYLSSVAAFLFFIRSIRFNLSLSLLAYSSFLYSSLDLTTLAYVTPDLLVSLFAFLAAGLLLRVSKTTASTFEYAALGLVLGLGYLSKSPFLIFGVLCVTLLAVLARKQRSALWRVLLATVVFAAIVIPYAWALSAAKGRLTFGDSGRYNVIWHVNGAPLYHWQGSPKNGTPVHPTRQLSTQPDIFEFAQPFSTTYPPGYDPVYWSEGAKIAFSPSDFARALIEQLKLYGYLVHHRQAPLLFALLVLLVLALTNRTSFASLGDFWPVLCLGIFPFAMYGVVHAEGRYLAPFFVLIWTGLFAGLLTGLPQRVDPKVLLSIAAVASVLMLAEALTAMKPEKPVGPHYAVARALQGLGLKSGDPVAIATADLDFYWARLTRARIAMEVSFTGAGCPDCRSHQAEWEKAKPILSSHGVMFFVSPCLPGVTDQPGWQQLATTNIYAYRLRNP